MAAVDAGGGTGVAFLGGGNLTKAVLGGFLAAGVLDAANVTVSTPHPEKLAAWAADRGVAVCADNVAAVAAAAVVYVVVKPHIVPAALAGVAALPGLDSKLFVSLAAGVDTEFLKGLLAPARLLRVMPNTPAAVGEAASALAVGPGATEGDMASQLTAFSAIGSAVEVPESVMDGAERRAPACQAAPQSPPPSLPQP